MTLKTTHAEIVDGCLVLSADALAVLPAGAQLFVLVDTEKATVSIHARNPMQPANQEFLESLAALNEGLTLEEYTRPAPHGNAKRSTDNGGRKR